MLRLTSSLLVKDEKQAKIHLQDTSHYWAEQVWGKLKGEFKRLSIHYQIKGAPLHQWIRTYGLQQMFSSLDPAVRRAMNELRQFLSDCVKPASQGGSFKDHEVNAFKQVYGNNVTDWVYHLAAQCKVASLLDGPDEAFEDVLVVVPDENDHTIALNMSGTITSGQGIQLSKDSLRQLERHGFTQDEIEPQILSRLHPQE